MTLVEKTLKLMKTAVISSKDFIFIKNTICESLIKVKPFRHYVWKLRKTDGRIKSRNLP